MSLDSDFFITYDEYGFQGYLWCGYQDLNHRLLQNSKHENLFKHQLSCIAAIKPAPNDYEGKHTKAIASAMAAPAEKRLLMLDNINENI
ncbi:hypothetical protein WN944_017148 [Citrus x changshan-huyou]|uniref:Uncharacterized protein n=1 Tax=Citrus x changshan-huyou TaxID=2935761 RepID=A0AAP0MAS7_9ROSI